jgi:hypothetical protein
MTEVRDLCLALTAILHTLARLQLWLHRPTHQGGLTKRPSLPSMPNKERYHRPRTFYPGTAFLPGTRLNVQLERNRVGEPSLFSEEKCLSLHLPIRSQGAKGGTPVERHSSPGLQSGEECREYVEALDRFSGAIPEDDRKLLPLLHRSLAQRVKEAVVNLSGPRATPQCVAMYTSARRCLPSCRYGHLSPSACADLCC